MSKLPPEPETSEASVDEAAVTLLNSDVSEMSKVERLKVASQGLFWVGGGRDFRR